MTDARTLAKQALDILHTWVNETGLAGAGVVYAFGSTINADGRQFDHRESDLDVLIVRDKFVGDAIRRVTIAEDLLEKKIDLEVRLLQLLRRPDASKPIASVLLTAIEEVQLNIHKTT